MTRLVRILLIGTAVIFLGTAVSAQIDPFNRDRQREEDAKIVKEMLAKMQSEREKKEHEELLKRADSALELSDELEKTFEQGHQLSADDRRLVELEKVVKKIRDDLGGDDDEEEEKAAKERPKDVKDAFLALRRSTLQLVDEVKKTTRYSISVAAIRSSNNVLKLLRFLRFRN